MKNHLKHLVMCAPMFVITAVLLFRGASIAALLPLIACVGMMWLMMMLMMGYQHGHPETDDPETPDK